MEALAQIKTNKSPGIDGISAKLLKDAGDTISESLANIFKLSLLSGIFPDDWKLARITPIYKDGSKTVIPISYNLTITYFCDIYCCQSI